MYYFTYIYITCMQIALLLISAIIFFKAQIVGAFSFQMYNLILLQFIFTVNNHFIIDQYKVSNWLICWPCHLQMGKILRLHP